MESVAQSLAASAGASHEDAQASQSQVAYAEYQYYKYLAHEELGTDLTEGTRIDDTMVMQRDGKLSSMKSRMEEDPTLGNVHELLDEIESRERIKNIFSSIFKDQAHKETESVELISTPRDFKCMRSIHQMLNTECDDILNNEYALQFNRFVVDFCETKQEDSLTRLDGVIHLVCGTYPNAVETEKLLRGSK